MQGINPVQWLNAFGHGINAAVNGDRGVPLPLGGAPQTFWRLRVQLHSAAGVHGPAWEAPYLVASLAGGAVALQKCRWVGRSSLACFPMGCSACVRAALLAVHAVRCVQPSDTRVDPLACCCSR